MSSTACAVCVTIFSTGGKFQNFTELHALTLAACSYALAGMQLVNGMLSNKKSCFHLLLVLASLACSPIWTGLGNDMGVFSGDDGTRPCGRGGECGLGMIV